MRARVIHALGLVLLGAPAAVAAELPPAEAVWAQLESRLLQARRVDIQFELKSEGAYPADFAGELRLEKPARAELSSRGSFVEEPMELMLSGSEGLLRAGRVGSDPLQLEAPKLQEALLLGMTRMGLLHNHAQLSAGAPPDHADTGIGDWLVAKNVRWSGRAAEREGTWAALAFDLQVSGSDAADVVLWLDEDGMPAFREQTVYFDGGSMTVHERTHVEIVDPQATCPPCRQKLAGFGHQLYVENGFDRIYVCCSGCAAKMQADWDGYRDILISLGEDCERRPTRVETPEVVNPLAKGVCAACLEGACERPEHLPGDQ